MLPTYLREKRRVVDEKPMKRKKAPRWEITAECPDAL